MVVVDRAGDLEETPSLINADVANEVRNRRPAISATERRIVGGATAYEGDLATLGACERTGHARKRQVSQRRRAPDRIDDLRAIVLVGAGLVHTAGHRHPIPSLSRSFPPPL